MNETCIACTGTPIGTVRDGAFVKPVCSTHHRLYGDKGYEVSPPVAPNAAA